MRNLFILGLLAIAYFSTSCAEKVKVDISKAPDEVVSAVEATYQLSKELTDLQVNAGIDKKIDVSEIEKIGETFRALVVLNNELKDKYEKDIYFIALSKERKDDFDKLSESVIFLKDCEGYDELGLMIQKISMEFNEPIK